MKRPLLIAIVLALLAGILGYNYYAGEQAGKNNTELILHGNVDLREVALAFPQSDRIAAVYVEEGDRVTAGTVLAKQDTQEIEWQLKELESAIKAQESVVAKLHTGQRPEQIRQAEARVNSAQAAADYAQNLYDRKQEIYAVGAISTQELDAARSDSLAKIAGLNEATALLSEMRNGYRAEDIAEGEARLEAIRTQLAHKEYILTEYSLIAPTDGVIRSRLLEVGDMANSNTPVFRLSLNTKKWVRVYVPETSLSDVFEGQQALIYLDSEPDKPIAGQVGYIAGTAEFTPKTVQTTELRTSLVYEVRIYVEDEHNQLRMGMPVTAKINKPQAN